MDDNFDRQRIDWIDFAKGITILLVIIGHNVSGPLRGAIFSFHMPLFFILIIPELSEPPVRTLGATIPENESHIFR